MEAGSTYLLTILWIATLSGDAHAEEHRWSTDFIKQVAALSCLPGDYYDGTVLRHRNNSGVVTQLGKVADMEVCSLLCCELENCDLALLQESHCYAIQCASRDRCETEKSPSPKMHSTIVQMKRRTGSDIWTREHPSNEVTANKYNEYKSTIITKQAVTSNSSAVGKSAISDTDEQKAGEESVSDTKGSFVTISSQEKSSSPMDELIEKESNILKVKASQNFVATGGNAKKSGPSVSEKIQNLSDHLKKADDRDATALEENDTSTEHARNKHRLGRDIKHSLISPITIGAFTCMAVIAVSGFAMAIIKYQRERAEKQAKAGE